MMIVTIWEMTLLLTLLFIAFALFLQAVMKKGQKEEHDSFTKLLEQNKILVEQLQHLQQQVVNLNVELTLLTEENKVLNNEVSSLTKEVSRLQVQVNNIK